MLPTDMDEMDGDIEFYMNQENALSPKDLLEKVYTYEKQNLEEIRSDITEGLKKRAQEMIETLNLLLTQVKENDSNRKLAQTHVENLTHTVEDLKATRATLSKVLEQAERHLHNVKEQNKILTQKLYRLQMAQKSSKYDQLNNFLNTAGKQGCDRIANPKGHISKESRSK